MRIVSGPSSWLLLLCVLLCVLLGAGACTSPGDGPGPDRPEAARSSAAAPGPPSRVWTAELKPLSEVTVVGGTALVLAEVRADEIEVVALDPATGTVRWRRAWSPGRVPTGFTLSVGTGRVGGADVVVVQDPGRRPGRDDSRTLPVLAVDVLAGAVVARTRPIELVSPPGECAGGGGLCVRGADGDGGSRTFRVDTAGLRADDSGLPPDAFEIADHGLFSHDVATDVRDTQGFPVQDVGPAAGVELGRVSGGRVRWTASLLALQGPDYDTAHGWRFDWDSGTRSWVGGVGTVLDQEQIDRFARGETGEVDLGRQQQISIRGADGTRRWGQLGLDACGLDVTTDPDDRRVVPVRCRTAGTRIEQRGHDVRFRGLEKALEGYDLQTGATTWSVPFTARQAERLQTGKALVAGPDSSWVLLEQPDGTQARVSTDDGSLTPTDPTEVLLCAQEQGWFRYAVGDPDSQAGDALRRPADVSRLCHPDGSRVAELGALPTAEAVRARGVAAGELQLVTTTAGVTAWRVP